MLWKFTCKERQLDCTYAHFLCWGGYTIIPWAWVDEKAQILLESCFWTMFQQFFCTRIDRLEHIVFIMSVCLLSILLLSLNIRCNFWMVRCRCFIFGMHTHSDDTKADDLVTLNVTFGLKFFFFQIWLSPGALHSTNTFCFTKYDYT